MDRRQLGATFVARSKRRVRIRMATTAVVGSLVVLSAMFAYSLFRITEDDAQTAGELAGRMQTQSFGLDLVDSDIYSALGLSTRLGDTEAALDGTVLSAALQARTPVDAFQVGAGDVAAILDVDRNVVVQTDDGTVWQRTADETGGRFATAAPGPPPTNDQPPAGTSVEQVAGVSLVRDGGSIVRAITPSLAPTVSLLSPDGRMLASAALDRVTLYDVETGHELITLSGAPETITDLAWTDDSSAIWGAGGPWAVKWNVRSGSVLVDDDTLAFRSVLPSPATEEIWLVEEAGRLFAVDRTGAALRDITIDAGILLSGAISDDGRSLVAVGTERVALVDLGTDGVTYLEHVCSQSKPAIVPEPPAAFVNCNDGLLRISLDGSGTTELTEVPGAVTSTPVAFDPTTGDIVMSAHGDPFYVLDGDEVRPLKAQGPMGCAADWLNLTVSVEGVIHPSGEGMGRIRCTLTGQPVGSGAYRWQHGAHDRASAHRSRASVFSPDGQMILTGLADGSIMVWPSDISPQDVLIELSGDILDIAIADDQVYAVSRSGMVAVFDMPARPSNAEFAAEAQRRLERASELGLIDG